MPRIFSISLKSLTLALITLLPAVASADTCTDRFNYYNPSSWWWGALGNCKQNPGGSTDREQIFGCAFNQIQEPAHSDTCFRNMLRASTITNNGIDVVVAFNTPLSCTQRFNYYDNSNWWWGALGNCKQNPGGSTDRDQIFTCAFNQIQEPERSDTCFRNLLRASPFTNNGIDVVVAYNTPPTCEQRFAWYNGSSWWWGALGNCKQNPGGSTDPDQIFLCAWNQVSQPDQSSSCLRTMMRNSAQTSNGINEVIAFNTPPTCAQLFAWYNGSSWWGGALQNCQKADGPATAAEVLTCAFDQVPLNDRSTCLKGMLGATPWTLENTARIAQYNGSVANNRQEIHFNTCATPSTGCPETCDLPTDGTVPAGYFSPSMPTALADATPFPVVDFGSPAAHNIGTNEGRLTAELRKAARLADPLGCNLQLASMLFAQGRSDDRARAFADLSVTGTRAFAAFKANLPREEYCESIVLRVPSRGCPSVGVRETSELYRGCLKALDRAYAVANHLRAGQALRVASPWYGAGGVLTPAAQAEKNRKDTERSLLGWIAVSGEDDAPHRPVNVPSSPSPQYDLDVDVETPDSGGASMTRVHTRFVVAQSMAPAPVALPPGKTGGSAWTLEEDFALNIAPGSEVILFIHGMDSRAEESEDITKALFTLGRNSPRNLVIISVDLPSSGYAQNLDYDLISPLSAIGAQITIFDPFLGGQLPDFYMTGKTPMLDFIENFIVRFAETLDARTPILSDVKAVMGGSLGGNMSFRLGRRKNTPWLPATVVWSPASIWNSLGAGADQTQHAGPYAAFGRAADRTPTDPNDLSAGRLGQRADFFAGVFDRPIAWGLITAQQPQTWTSDYYACKYSAIAAARLDRHETYAPHFRTWRWRLAAEQLLYSHQTIDPATGLSLFKANDKRMLLACGAADNVLYNGICSATEATAPFMTTTPGKALFLNQTGHSLDNERPVWFAGQISSFLKLF